MAEKLTINFTPNIVPECIGDISILLIDHEAISVACLTTMLKQRLYKVISVNATSEAVSIIENQKDIGLVIANIEVPHIDSHSFLNAMLHTKIPLILIGPEINLREASDLLTKRACFCLKKPIFENVINNLWHHVVADQSQEIENINMAEQQDNIVDESMKHIEGFRENIKRQRVSQSSLLGRRPSIKTFTTSEMYQKRKSIANDEWKPKAMCPMEIENKGSTMGNIVARRKTLWTRDRHMKFLAAISILGAKGSRPKAILKIMNDPNLNHRQVGSHLQKYKTQVERASKTIKRNECISTDETFEYPPDFEYPFNASNITENLIESNSLWYSLRKKKLSSSSTVQYSFKKPDAEREAKMLKFHLGGKFDLSTDSLSGNMLNRSSMKVTYVPSATSNHPSYNSGLSSDNPHVLSGLPSNVGASAEINISQSNPSPPQPSNSVLETNRNPFDFGPSYIPDSNVPQGDLCTMGETYFLPDATMNPLETHTNQMDWDFFFSDETYALLEDMNSSETNTTQVGLVPLETSYAEELGLVPSEEGNDIPIEDLISFDTDVNEMDLDSWFENYDASQRDVPLPVSHNGQDLAFTATNSIPQVSMEDHDPSEALEGENHFDDDFDQNMDWIDEMLDQIA